MLSPATRTRLVSVVSSEAGGTVVKGSSRGGGGLSQINLSRRLLEVFFVVKVLRELVRVNERFAGEEKKMKEIFSAFSREEDNNGVTSEAKDSEAEIEVQLLEQRYKDLSRFINLNYTAFLKILKKFDKVTGQITLKPFLTLLSTEVFVNNDIQSGTFGSWCENQIESSVFHSKMLAVRKRMRKAGQLTRKMVSKAVSGGSSCKEGGVGGSSSCSPISSHNFPTSHPIPFHPIQSYPFPNPSSRR